ncbi:MAG: HAD family hydrolase [Caldisericota bacterium]|nr:HAD family hydrolase [Caldisericota bacterium]
MIKLVTLDLWDTLITDKKDNERERDLKRTDFILKTLNLPDEYRGKIADYFNELDKSLKHLSNENDWAITPEAQLQHLFTTINAHPSNKQFLSILKFYTECDLDNPPVLIENDINICLEKLKDNYNLVLISNTGRTPGRVLKKLLKEFKILNYFDMLIFSDEVEMRKPEPKIFFTACEAFHVLSKEAVHVGDSILMDFNGALSAKVNPVLYLPNGNPPVTPFIRSLFELKDSMGKYYDKN